MKRLTLEEFLVAAGNVPRGSLTAYVNKGEAVFAFGAREIIAGGVFMDLDAVVWLALDELSSPYTRRGAAWLLRAFADQFVDAVAKAEATDEAVYFAIAESGTRKLTRLERRTHAIPMRDVHEHINCGTFRLSDLAELKMTAARTVPKRMVLMNVSALITEARSNASAIALDLSSPMVLLDEPAFVEAKRELIRVREAARRRPTPTQGAS